MLLCALLASSLLAAEPTVYWLAPDGDDTAAGTANAPWRSPARAAEAVRALPRPLAGQVVVRLRGGLYPLAAPLELGPADGGTMLVPVRWEAAEGAVPVLSGGVPLPPWVVRADGLWEASLPAEVDAALVRELYLWGDGGYDARRYRPTSPMLVIGGLTDAPTAPGATMAHRRSQDEFIYRPGDLDGVQPGDGTEVVAFHDWSSSRLLLREIDTAQRVVRFTGYPVYRIGHWYEGGRNPYFLDNYRSALATQPGRFWVDVAVRQVLYHPLPGEDPATAGGLVPQLTELVRLRGTQGLEIAGVTFAHTAWRLPPQGYSSGQAMVDLPCALDAGDARDVLIEGCTFRSLGATAVRLGEGCTGCIVRGCLFDDLGGGGVLLGTTRRQAEEPAVPVGNEVVDNVLRDGGLLHYSAVGIWLGFGQRNLIAHNLVERWPYSGISAGWAWDSNASPQRENAINYNHVHHAMQWLADGGAFYSLGWQPGTSLRGNHFHSIARGPFAGRAPNNCIFFDEGSRAFEVADNVLHTCEEQLIRYNQCVEGDQIWGDNSLGPAPGEAGFPVAAALAGPREPWTALAERPPLASPHPLAAMTLPTVEAIPRPPLNEDFERNAPGELPANLAAHGENAAAGALIRISDETAASGTQSLRLRRTPGLARPFYPYLTYQADLRTGTARVAFAFRLEPGAGLSLDLREDLPNNQLISALRWRADAGATWQAGAWYHFEVTVPLGVAGAEVSLRVRDAAGAVVEERVSSLADAAWRRLDRVVITPAGAEEMVLYLDDIVVRGEP